MIEKENIMRYIYSRTSTKEQNVVQQSQLLQSNYTDAVLHEEQASATSMSRPILDNLLNSLVAGDYLIIYDLSRLNRNTADFLSLLQKFNENDIGLIIHSMGGSAVDSKTPIGRMILTTLAAVEQMNVELMKEKQKIGIATAKAEGKYKGRPINPETDKNALCCL